MTLRSVRKFKHVSVTDGTVSPQTTKSRKLNRKPACMSLKVIGEATELILETGKWVSRLKKQCMGFGQIQSRDRASSLSHPFFKAR